MIGYPRTFHIEGSLGRYASDQVALASVPGSRLVIEEKLDGSQAAIFFEGNQLHLFSRGEPLGPHPAWAFFKAWAATQRKILWDVLGHRYVLFGECLYAHHAIFYDALPHIFLEFDIWDREAQYWLSTPKRQRLLKGSGILSVPIVYEGERTTAPPLADLIAPCLYQTIQWRACLIQKAREHKLDPAQLLTVAEQSGLPEGLYLKAETDEVTLGRYKYVRAHFLAAILESKRHWAARPVLPNGLAAGVILF
jgi:hypothetical protein